MKELLLDSASRIERIRPNVPLINIYEGRSRSKVSYFFSRGMEADRNVKVVGGDVAVL